MTRLRFARALAMLTLVAAPAVGVLYGSPQGVAFGAGMGAVAIAIVPNARA